MVGTNKTGDDEWYVSILDVTESAITIKNSTLSSLPWIYIAVNVYDIDSCQEYPAYSEQECSLEPYPPCNEMPFVNIYLDDPYKQIPWTVGTGENPPVCNTTLSTFSVADPTDDVYITFNDDPRFQKNQYQHYGNTTDLHFIYIYNISPSSSCSFLSTYYLHS